MSKTQVVTPSHVIVMSEVGLLAAVRGRRVSAGRCAPAAAMLLYSRLVCPYVCSVTFGVACCCVFALPVFWTFVFIAPAEKGHWSLWLF